MFSEQIYIKVSLSDQRFKIFQMEQHIAEILVSPIKDLSFIG